MTLHIIAYVVNAHESDPQIEFTLASQIEDRWVDNNGDEQWPFWTTPFTQPDLQIPEGWIEHLHAEAIKMAAKAKPLPSNTAGKSLLASLGFKVNSPIVEPFKRRI